MPTTVPNRPTNGAMLAVVARNVIRLSSLLTSTTEARINLLTAAIRRSEPHAGIPATAYLASIASRKR